jgi:TRAP-type C4-dicarboxylate transport system substrate-binding protein
MKSLFADIVASGKKTAFQTYVLEHGIEKLNIKIPLAAVAMFEDRFSKLPSKDKQAITELVSEAGGKIS